MGEGEGGGVEFDITRLEGVEGVIFAHADLRSDGSVSSYQPVEGWRKGEAGRGQTDVDLHSVQREIEFLVVSR